MIIMISFPNLFIKFTDIFAAITPLSLLNMGIERLVNISNDHGLTIIFWGIPLMFMPFIIVLLLIFGVIPNAYQTIANGKNLDVGDEGIPDIDFYIEYYHNYSKFPSILDKYQLLAPVVLYGFLISAGIKMICISSFLIVFEFKY